MWSLQALAVPLRCAQTGQHGANNGEIGTIGPSETGCTAGMEVTLDPYRPLNLLQGSRCLTASRSLRWRLLRPPHVTSSFEDLTRLVQLSATEDL